MAMDAAELYREDFYAWTREQAAALRKLAAERWNGPLDLEHLAEEIEDVGSDRRDVVVSQLRRLMVYLLKTNWSVAREERTPASPAYPEATRRGARPRARRGRSRTRERGRRRP